MATEYVRDAWEPEPGELICKHGGQIAMDNEGVVRHKGSGSLCDVVPLARQPFYPYREAPQ